MCFSFLVCPWIYKFQVIKTIENQCKKCTTEDHINYIFAIGFLAIFICCMIVIATIGSLQWDITTNFVNNTVLFDCYYFADCHGNNVPCDFQLNPSDNSCGAAWGIYSILAIVSLGFIIASIAKPVLHKKQVYCNNNEVHFMHFCRLNETKHWFLLLEMVIILICVLVSLSMSITLTIGRLTTCRSIEKFNGNK